MYKVIRYFTDLQDNNYLYQAGDIFPRDGLSVSKKRLAELSGSNNRQRRPLIEPVQEARKITKTEINRMSTDELRRMAMNMGVSDAIDMTGKELKEYLIRELGL